MAEVVTSAILVQPELSIKSLDQIDEDVAVIELILIQIKDKPHCVSPQRRRV